MDGEALWHVKEGGQKVERGSAEQGKQGTRLMMVRAQHKSSN